MSNFLESQLLFCLSIILVLFLPGYFLLSAIEARKKYFSALEKFVISFGLSIVSCDFLMILAGKAGISLNRKSILLSILLFCAICLVIKYFYRKLSRPAREETDKNAAQAISSFSKNQTALVVLILFLAVFIKTAYLSNAIFPTSTDLGHHMYWSKIIAQTGNLPAYQERDIVKIGKNYGLSEPQKIADFIIGEHLIFAAINLISGIDFISYFPSLVLLLVDIFSLLAIFLLALKFFEKSDYGKNLAILSLLFIGPLYALSSPQAKFASGGVIGNLIGNLLIPLSLYFFYRALSEKNSTFFSLALFLTAGLFYTHHLSALIFILIFAFSALIYLILNIKKSLSLIEEWLSIFFSPQTVILLLFILFVLFFVYAPTYLDKSVIDTAVGTPEKSTRTGLTFTQFKFTAGEARMALGIVGALLLLASKKRDSYQNSILLGWTGALFIMSLAPALLFINIPSNRIATYISFPLAVLAAYSIFWLLKISQNKEKNVFYIPAKILYPALVIIFAFSFASGFYDNSQSLNTGSNSKEAVQTFHASKYLAGAVDQTDTILKDHNYITADSWIKIFFMRDYNFPLSRGYFKRYEDEFNKREMCTLWMISTPNLDQGQKCYNDTGIDFIMVNPQFDKGQFEKSREFSHIYASDEISIYYRK